MITDQFNPDYLPDDSQTDQTELYEHYHIEVDPGQTMLRIDKYLSDHIRNVSRNRIQQAADAECILVNGNPVKASYRVKGRDTISIVMAQPPRDTDVKPENIELDIVYEDADLLVVNKCAGMVVHPAHGNYSGTLVNALLYHLRDVPLFSSGEVRPGLVHRIDKNTSGLLVIAKTELAMNRLARQFFERSTSRLYVALVWGDLKTDRGTIQGNIGRSTRDRKRMQVFADPNIGKNAITNWSVLERFGHTTLVECRLQTGRTHQIRVHFEHIGHPLFNDEVYGGNRIIKGNQSTKYKQFIDNCFALCPRQALHAKTLGFTHPTTGQVMSFSSDLPTDMAQLINKWRNFAKNCGIN